MQSRVFKLSFGWVATVVLLDVCDGTLTLEANEENSLTFSSSYGGTMPTFLYSRKDCDLFTVVYHV